jgi:spore maturation protein CgeB
VTGAPLRLVVLGLSLSSSWGNGHATTYRALLKAFARRGHAILFLEREVPWYADHRDLVAPDYCDLAFYRDLADLERFRDRITAADAVIVGSYVPEGAAVGRRVRAWTRSVCAFYDIDTPVTLAKLEARDHAYLTPDLIRAYDLYLSFTGGPTLRRIEARYGSPAARQLYCSVDPAAYPVLERDARWDLSYLGTYSPDRQPTLTRLLVDAARDAPHLRFVVAGPQYPDAVDWPRNVERIEHVAPRDHPAFYAASRYTLNVTRADMIRAGYSPSVRLFEAAACGTPILTDCWEGLETVLIPGREILPVETTADVLGLLEGQPEIERQRLADAARARVLASHSAEHRAAELDIHLREAVSRCGNIIPQSMFCEVSSDEVLSKQ